MIDLARFLLLFLVFNGEEVSAGIDLFVNDLGASQDQVLIGFCASEATCLKKPCLAAVGVIKKDVSAILVENISSRPYAISVFHDENNNGDLGIFLKYLRKVQGAQTTLCPDLPPLNGRLQKMKWCDMGSVAYFRKDTAPYCQDVVCSLELFANFKPVSNVHPNWGADRVAVTLEKNTK